MLEKLGVAVRTSCKDILILRSDTEYLLFLFLTE